MVKGPWPAREQCLEELLEMVLLVTGEGQHGLLEHGGPGLSDRGRYCPPLFSERDRGGAGVRAAADAADKAALVQAVKQPNDGGMSQLQPSP
jgi:hypothetical protein